MLRTFRLSTLSSRAIRRPSIAFNARCYAHSRFPDRNPVGGRSRTPPPRVTPRNANAPPQPGESYEGEAKSSETDSPLWKESQRPPSGDPEVGLSRLLMDNKSLVVTRQIEMLNIFIGMEQANRYVIADAAGQTLGYIAEEDKGLSFFSRQMFGTHRPFRAIVMDRDGTPVLWIYRPFNWINSRMFVSRLKDFKDYTPEGGPVLDTFAEVQQRWHPWRRRYDLFLRESHRVLSVIGEPQPESDREEQFSQFAEIDEGLWAWDFTLRGAQGEPLAKVSRAWRGLGREIFTDTGSYAITFDPQLIYADSLDPYSPIIDSPALTLDQRALVLATAVNIDFDYFSRHSHGGGMPMVFGHDIE